MIELNSHGQAMRRVCAFPCPFLPLSPTSLSSITLPTCCGSLPPSLVSFPSIRGSFSHVTPLPIPALPPSLPASAARDLLTRIGSSEPFPPSLSRPLFSLPPSLAASRMPLSAKSSLKHPPSRSSRSLPPPPPPPLPLPLPLPLACSSAPLTCSNSSGRCMQRCR